MRVKTPVPFRTVERKRQEVDTDLGVPRIGKLMTPAIRFDRLRLDGDVRNQAELGRVSKTRVSQIPALLNLAPDIQEAILFLERWGGEGAGDGEGVEGGGGGTGV